MVDNDLQELFLSKLVQSDDKLQLIQDIYDSFDAATIAKENRAKTLLEDMKRYIQEDIEKNHVGPADVGYMAALVFAKKYPMATYEQLLDVADSAVKDVYGDI